MTLLDRLEAFRRGVLLVVVAGVPLLILLGVTNDPYDVPKLGLSMAGTGLVLGLRLIELPWRSRSAEWRIVLIPALAVGLPLVAAWAFSPYRGWTLMGSYARFMGLLPYLVVIVLAVLIADAFRRDVMPILWTLTFAGAVVGGYAFLQILGIDPLGHLFENPPITTATSTIGNTNFVGGFLAVVLPISLVLWATQDGLQKHLALISMIMIADGLIFSFSQGGYAAAVAGVSVALGGILQPKWRRARAIGLAAAGIAAVLLILVVLAASIKPDLGLGTTAKIRGFWWMAAVRMAAESPLLGQGPNSFAIEGSIHRSMQDVLTTPSETPDNPHSLFFTILTGAGLFGATGLVIAAGWALARGIKVSSTSSSALALTAATTAYLVQSLVSVDEVTLRTTFWICLGAIAVVGTGYRNDAPGEKQRVLRNRSGMPRKLISGAAVALGILVSCGAIMWAGGFVLADMRIEQGSDLFEEQSVDAAIDQYDQALDFREEREYRLLYGEKLGFAALDTELQDLDLVEASRRQFELAIDLPDYRPLAIYARTLHYFGSYDRSYESAALQLNEAAIELNPFNPLLRVDMSDILLRLGRAEDVLPGLSVDGDLLGTQLPSVWSSISMAETMLEDYGDAQEALNEALARGGGGCRLMMAQELLEAHRGGRSFAPSDARLAQMRFICTPGEYQLLVDLVPAGLRHLYESD